MKRAKQLLSITLVVLFVFLALSPAVQAAAAGDSSPFKDTSKHWAKQSIETLVGLGIIDGYEDGTFRPENEVTRAQFVAMTIRMIGYEAKGTSAVFNDLPTSHWAYPAVQAALEQGVIAKEDFGQNFEPNKAMTREEMAVVTAKALELKAEDEKTVLFKDKGDMSQNIGLVGAAAKAGMINGYADKTFKPKNKLTRAQASVVLVRMYDYINGAFFRDLENHWAKNEIQSLVELGIINGYEDGTFRPENMVTRIQFTALTVRMMGYETEGTVQSFEDIPSSHWAHPVVQAAIEQGILVRSEYGSRFEPNKPLTREEMAIMMARTLKLTPEDVSALTFKDKGSITKEQGLLSAAVKAGLINGRPDNTFGPKATSTRAQASAILKRLYDYSMNSEDPNVPTPSPKRASKDEIQVLDGVKEIPQQTAASLETVTDDDSVFTFTGTSVTISTLKEGDIFILPPSNQYPSGFAEKVVSVTTQSGKTIVKTVNPEITEVFEEIDIQEETPVTFEDLIPIEIPEGVTFEALEPEESIIAAKYQGKVTAKEEKKGKDFKIKLKDFNFKVNKTDVKVAGEIAFRGSKLETDVDYKLLKLKSLETRFVSNPRLNVKVSIPRKEFASGEAGAKVTSSKVYKGIDFGAKANVPKWMKEQESTGPFEKRKSIGKFYLPVYGPVGASFEAFLVVKADLSVGIALELTEDVQLDVGIKAKNGDVSFKPRKADFKKPNVVIKGDGGAQMQAGAGMGLKLAVFKLDVGGIEGVTGLKGEVYGRGSAGYGDEPNPDTKEKGPELNFCYRAGVGGFAEVNATFDILKKLRLVDKAYLTLLKKEKTFAELSNCKDGMLAAAPPLLILAPGESAQVDLGLYTYDDVNLVLSKEKGKLKDETLSYALESDNVVTVEAKPNTDGYAFNIKVNEEAESGDIGELQFTYQEKEGSKKITETVKIFILAPDELEAEPSQLTLKSGGKKQLSVKAIYKQPKDDDLKELEEEDLNLNELFNPDVTTAEGITYTSKNPAVATVDSKGNVTAKKVDKDSSTDIEVSYKGKTDTVLVNVKADEQRPSSGGGGNSSSPATLSEQQIKNIILEAEKKADETFRPEAESGNEADFADVKPKLKDYYSDNYLDNYWKKVYDVNIAWFTDPHLLYPLTEAKAAGTESTFKVDSQTSDSLTASVSVPLRDHEIKDDSFTYQYSIKKVNGQWILDDITGVGNERPQIEE